MQGHVKCRSNPCRSIPSSQLTSPPPPFRHSAARAAADQLASRLSALRLGPTDVEVSKGCVRYDGVGPSLIRYMHVCRSEIGRGLVWRRRAHRPDRSTQQRSRPRTFSDRWTGHFNTHRHPPRNRRHAAPSSRRPLLRRSRDGGDGGNSLASHTRTAYRRSSARNQTGRDVITGLA